MSISREEQLKRLREMDDSDIVYDEDAPETDESFWKDAKLLTPLKKKTKDLKSMRFDPDLYAWYEQHASQLKIPTQSLMHKVLESYKQQTKEKE